LAFNQGPDLQRLDFTIILSCMKFTITQRGARSLVFQGYKRWLEKPIQM